jgi:hypothetical protein
MNGRTAFDASGRLKSEFTGAIYECSPYCSCPLTCGQRRVQQSQTPLDKLELYSHPQKGLGVRTTKDIPKGTFICEYTGEKIGERVAKIRNMVCSHAGIGVYMFQLDYGGGPEGTAQQTESEWCIDAIICGNISRFFNHSCDGGNLRKVIMFAGHLQMDEQRICFFTNRNVRKGEELTFDYGTVQFQPCACGSAVCRRAAVGK